MLYCVCRCFISCSAQATSWHHMSFTILHITIFLNSNRLCMFQVADELVAEFAEPSNSLTSPDKVCHFSGRLIKMLLISIFRLSD